MGGIVFETITPIDAGMDEAMLSRAMDEAKIAQLHGVVVVRGGKLVAEYYPVEYGPRIEHPQFSVSKSITSILVGIAIDLGHISEDARLLDFFPEYREKIADAAKNEIALKHILTHTSGLRWHELNIPYDSDANSHFDLERSSDWMGFVLSRPMEHKIGKIFEYNTGAFHLFSAIIERTSGIKFEDFAFKYLFEPLGIDRPKWAHDPNGFACAGGSDGGVFLSPRDVAQIGQMVMSGGEWDDRRIVDADWIARSTTRHIETEHGAGYGYGWWIWRMGVVDFIAAKGYAGQALIIVPKLDLIIVFTGDDLAKAKKYNGVLDRIVRSIS